jgi:hypothetical protein
MADADNNTSSPTRLEAPNGFQAPKTTTTLVSQQGSMVLSEDWIPEPPATTLAAPRLPSAGKKVVEIDVASPHHQVALEGKNGPRRSPRIQYCRTLSKMSRSLTGRGCMVDECVMHFYYDEDFSSNHPPRPDCFLSSSFKQMVENIQYNAYKDATRKVARAKRSAAAKAAAITRAKRANVASASASTGSGGGTPGGAGGDDIGPEL